MRECAEFCSIPKNSKRIEKWAEWIIHYCKKSSINYSYYKSKFSHKGFEVQTPKICQAFTHRAPTHIVTYQCKIFHSVSPNVNGRADSQFLIDYCEGKKQFTIQ